MFIRRHKKGQSTAEYAILIGLVIAAAVGIQALIKEGMHKRIFSEVSKLQDNEAAGTTNFSVTASTDTDRTGTEKMTVEKGGKATKEIVGQETINRTTNESYNF